MRLSYFSFPLYLALSVACAALPVPASADDASCQLKMTATIPAKIENGRLLAKMQLDDRDVWMKIGTNEPDSEIAWQTARKMKLPFRDLPEKGAIDDAGKPLLHYVKIHTVGLGGLKAHDIGFVVAGESSQAPALQDGTFGADFLTAYDVEFDLAHGKINLYDPKHCPGKVVYWTENYFKIPFTLDYSNHAIFPVTLDGQEVHASLDTASVGSTLTTMVAKRKFNFDPVGSGAQPDGQEIMSSGASLPFYLHRFGNFAIGDIAFRNTEFEIVPNAANKSLRRIEPRGIPLNNPNQEMQMAIGLHHLARVRFYIAYGERTIYFSAADAN